MTELSPEDRRRFARRVERMVTPGEVGRLHQRAEMLGRLPLRAQDWVIDRAGGRDAQIGFVVEPYAAFLAYEITDLAAASALLPEGYDLLPATMFAGGQPRPMCIIGAFAVHTSVFWGVRLELSLIAEHRERGMLTWVICEVESNTISHEPGRGFARPSATHAMLTTTYAGEVLIDIVADTGANRITGSLDLAVATTVGLDERLWVEGNLSVDYGGGLGRPGAPPFGLVFDPGEVAAALQVPLNAVQLPQNTVAASMRLPEPFEVACFPYAQHYLTSSFPTGAPITTRDQLLALVREVANATD
ncbi:MAG: hypothetical protein IPL94_07070 [Tetrasphaera sp.]|nr:hypothetical protein [Tetrasphaera sp.]